MVSKNYANEQSELPLITRQRHRLHIQECLRHIQQFHQYRIGHEIDFFEEENNSNKCADIGPDLSEIADGENGDLVLAAEQLRLATRSLGRVVGTVDVEELLDVIFKDFCIGK